MNNQRKCNYTWENRGIGHVLIVACDLDVGHAGAHFHYQPAISSEGPLVVAGSLEPPAWPEDPRRTAGNPRAQL